MFKREASCGCEFEVYAADEERPAGEGFNANQLQYGFGVLGIQLQAGANRVKTCAKHGPAGPPDEPAEEKD